MENLDSDSECPAQPSQAVSVPVNRAFSADVDDSDHLCLIVKQILGLPGSAWSTSVFLCNS